MVGIVTGDRIHNRWFSKESFPPSRDGADRLCDVANASEHPLLIAVSGHLVDHHGTGARVSQLTCLALCSAPRLLRQPQKSRLWGNELTSLPDDVLTGLTGLEIL